MTQAGRDAIFNSHANPEDNALAVWLGTRLPVFVSGRRISPVSKLRSSQCSPRSLLRRTHGSGCDAGFMSL